MAEDLLDEIEEPERDHTGEDSGKEKPDPSGKKGLLGKILGNRKRMVLFLVLVLVIFGAIAGAWFFFFSDPSNEETGTMGKSGTVEDGKPEQEEVFQDIVTFESFERLPLKSGSTMERISLSLSLELMDYRYQMQVYSMEDRIRRIVQNQVRELAWLELRSPEGKIRLKYELLKSINALFPKAMVRNLYFTNFIMQ
ncbi:flagellar basal body-associated FliL family protein [Desulfospira joergensenii]|uniref:flagellar basal body-associated FliL family protein n=1 Tax=Desulfospira joergensenii TaxID=53329 RepID=UPI0003B592B0|nr:flagellar basal body-associated FliL family protein [Desulfospira joergensenii]